MECGLFCLRGFSVSAILRVLLLAGSSEADLRAEGDWLSFVAKINPTDDMV
jgi:hypothetical protein